MKTLIAFGVLLLTVYLGSVRLFSRVKASTPFSYLLYSGTVFLFFGFIVGQNGFNLISPEVVHDLAPLIHFSLGWVGFIFGFQLELKYLRRIPQVWYFYLITLYLATLCAIFFLCFSGLRFFTGSIIPPSLFIGFSAVVSILASDSSVSFTVWSSRFFRDQGEHLRFCIFVSSLDNLFPMMAVGALFSFYHSPPGANGVFLVSLTQGMFFIIIHTVIGLAGGLTAFFLLKRVEERFEISTVLFGIVFFIAGIARLFEMSTLYLAMITGMVISNSSLRHTHLLKITSSTEKPIYLIFLIYLAMQKIYIDVAILAIALLILLVKLFSRLGVLKMFTLTRPGKFIVPPYYAYLLLPISNVAPAILLDLSLSFPHTSLAVISGIFIFLLILSEIMAPSFFGLIRRQISESEVH